VDRTAEWLEADGLGGFASGTVSGIRTRRYHALLLPACSPPTGRVVLVNGFEAWVETAAGSFALSSQAYLPDVVHPDGVERLEAFTHEPWPRWTYRLPDGTRIDHELVVRHGAGVVVATWRATGPSPGVLRVRPLLSGRDYHALHRENPGFRFAAEEAGPATVVWRPYEGIPAVVSRANGAYAPDPVWYRRFRYDEERARGLDFEEDLASPGVLTFDLSAGEAVWLIAAEGQAGELGDGAETPEACARRLRAAERTRRETFASPLHRAADAYLARRGAGWTIVAGYPWFTDWGRDTFIALRGLCIATGRLETARDILLEWSHSLSEGMLPNRFPDRGEAPELNSVDASLWYVVAVHELLAAARGSEVVAREARERLLETVEAILEGYARGTHHGIRADGDGLLAAGEPGVQLTWMDAKVGDRVVTPRIGKPVEVQALWLNALRIGGVRSARWRGLFVRGAAAFAERFWNARDLRLHDVVDADHHPGAVDRTFRPNQILAVGGLPFALLEGERAQLVVDAVEHRLVTPLGLRSLAPGEPDYRARYEGGVRERDGAYHQGTVWPWLLGPFVEAWVRVRGGGDAAKREARRRFLEPLLARAAAAGLGHLPEIADAEPPFTPRGCPFQAWSVGEALRLDLVVLATGAAGTGAAAGTAGAARAPFADEPRLAALKGS
jgi:predicted glycogen debranching enzyme